FFFSSRRRHTRSDRDWSSDVCSSDLAQAHAGLDQQDGEADGDARAALEDVVQVAVARVVVLLLVAAKAALAEEVTRELGDRGLRDRKSTRLNSSHDQISYAVFCLKKK